MFEHQGLLENRDSSRRIDQPPLFLGSFTSSRRAAARPSPSSAVRLPTGPVRRSAAANRAARSRAFAAAGPSPPLKLRGRPTQHLDRLVLSDHRHQLRNLIGTGPDRRQRIRQHAAGVTRSHPDPRISPIDRNPYAAPEASRSSFGEDPGESCGNADVHVRSSLRYTLLQRV